MTYVSREIRAEQCRALHPDWTAQKVAAETGASVDEVVACWAAQDAAAALADGPTAEAREEMIRIYGSVQREWHSRAQRLEQHETAWERRRLNAALRGLHQRTVRGVA